MKSAAGANRQRGGQIQRASDFYAQFPDPEKVAKLLSAMGSP